MVAEFEKRISAKVRQQENLDRTKKKNYRRRELLEKYMAKILYR